MKIVIAVAACLALALAPSSGEPLPDSGEVASGGGGGGGRYCIEGRVYPPEQLAEPAEVAEWLAGVRVLLNGGESVAFARADGGFSVWGAGGGSHVVQPVHAEYALEGARVEINSKGKFRARRLNAVQSSLVIQVPYPLRVKPVGRYKYFQAREQWRITDFLFNPMVLMMVLPFLIIMILPKMMNDPETKKEMEQLTNMTKMREMPEMSEMIASIFGKTAPPKPAASAAAKSKAAKKRQ